MLSKRVVTPGDVHRCALRGAGLCQEQRAVREIERGQSSFLWNGDAWLSPPQSTCDHQVENHVEIAGDRKDDAFAHPADTFDDASLHGVDRGRD